MASRPDKVFYDVNEAEKLFEQFIKDHDKKYKDDDEKKFRYEIFVQSLGKINKMNEASPSATFGINKFADYTKEEMQQMCGVRQ